MSDLDSVNETLMRLSGSAFDLGNEILASRLKALAVMTIRGKRELTDRHDELVAALRQIIKAEDQIDLTCSVTSEHITKELNQRKDEAITTARALLKRIDEEAGR